MTLWHCLGDLIEQISHIALVFLLLNINKYM